MRSPIDIYIFIPILLKTVLGIILPVINLKTMLIDVGVGFSGLVIANILHHLNDDCSKNPSSFGGRVLKSSTDAFAQYFGGMLFSLLVVVVPFLRMPVIALSKLPGSSYVLENAIWGVGVLITTILINSTDSASMSQADICKGSTSFSRMVISLVVFVMACYYQFKTM